MRVQKTVLSAMTGVLFASASAAATYVTPVYPSTAAKSSFIRLHNPTAAAGVATVNLRRIGASASLGATSFNIPAGASLQAAVKDIEAAAGITPLGANDSYALAITTTFNGFAQHVVWNAAASSMTNLSHCGPALAADGGQAANLHTSLLPGYLSAVVLYNTGASARAATLTIRDARTGQQLGQWASPAIAAGASSRQFTVSEILNDARVAVGTGLYHINVALDANFAGFIQHLGIDVVAARTNDMTAKCTLTAGGAT